MEINKLTCPKCGNQTRFHRIEMNLNKVKATCTVCGKKFRQDGANVVGSGVTINENGIRFN